MHPKYVPTAFNPDSFDDLLKQLPWVHVTPARSECFMRQTPTNYTYGKGVGARTYTAAPYHPLVAFIQETLNKTHRRSYNACFANHYANERQHLGWHADDSMGTASDHSIAVVSFGAPREIWWRKKGQTGAVPPEQRQLLEPGSLFVMPEGFQQAYEHRIPKADRPCGGRISLTFRCYTDTSEKAIKGLSAHTYSIDDVVSVPKTKTREEA